MSVEVTWLGHNCWQVCTGQHTLLIDPFLNDSPTAPRKADQVSPDYILVSHGHFDHIADCVEIAKRCDATVLANFEICQWLSKQGVQKAVGHNIGGSSQHPWGRVKFTIAYHSSELPDGTYGGSPAGLLLRLDEATIYFACDTAFYSDMRLLALAKVDLAVVPIGDLFTMGPDDAVDAAKLIVPRRVAPCHYNTWPPIAQDAAAWAARIRAETQALPWTPEPGESITL